MYNGARAAGQSGIEALANRFGASRSTVKNWPTAARKAGLIVDQAKTPLHEPPATPSAGERRVLMCTDCNAEFDHRDTSKLFRHTSAEHGRSPTVDEKKSVPARG